MENGYKVFKRNNLGLYGTDVAWSHKDTLIYVLGSSYLEGAQWPPDSIAVSYLQQLFDLAGKSYKVINLGHSGYDPYILFYRLSWFEKLYRNGKVILVLEDSYEKWLMNQPHPLTFTLPSKFGVSDRRLITQLTISILNHSAAAYLIRQATKFTDIEENGFLNPQQTTDAIEGVPLDLLICLDAYQIKYGDDFVVLSIMDNLIFNTELEQYCSLKKINFCSRSINKASNKIKGKGHLTIYGNKQLAMALYGCL